MNYAKYSENLEKRVDCNLCRKKRKFANKYDKIGEEKKKHNDFSPFVGIISNPSSINPPADILIICEGHGGGDWSKIKNAKCQAQETYKYYLCQKIKTFHQHEIRDLLNELTNLKKTWVLTDFIHCYVRNKYKFKKDGWWKSGRRNKKKAAELCTEYNQRIIDYFRPMNIVLFGDNVGKWYKRCNTPKNSEVKQFSFPSQMAADAWVRNGGVNAIIKWIKKST